MSYVLFESSFLNSRRSICLIIFSQILFVKHYAVFIIGCDYCIKFRVELFVLMTASGGGAAGWLSQEGYHDGWP